MFGDEFKLRQIQRRYVSDINESAYATLLLHKPSDKLRVQSVTFIRGITSERVPSTDFSVSQ